ncbi:MAG: tetratricopeptide repeat protein [Acidobacteria bacterium]|nr:tetratricopeptide repeat protein [Acidobacteriota bacterium]
MRSAADRLDSWKEIAAHLRRGTRTVQRWEREQGLPVHRLRHELGSTVYAYRSELDAWMARQRTLVEHDAGTDEDLGPSVAVLPFTDISREKDQEYFCEGMAEEILNALSRLQGLRVASRMSSFQCKNAPAGSREIGRRLRVRTLLEGSVRKAQNQLRIAAQLTDAETGYQLWAGTYDRELSDVFAVQEEIAHSIVEKLEVTLSAEESGALRQAPTRHFEAYDCYLRGRKFYYHYNRRDVEFAIQLFSRAIQLDPAFVLAHAGLADCWSYIYMYAARTEDARRQADEASLRAVELDSRSAQAQASRGLSLSLSWRDEDSEKAFELAVRLDPSLFEAHYFYARHRFARGELERAIELYEKAVRVRPEDYQSPLLMAQSYEALGRPERARAARERGIRLAEEQLQANPDDTRAMYMAANGLVGLRELGRGLAWAERAIERQPEEPMVLYNVGCVYALAGKLDPALEVLERAVENGLTQKGWYLHDSNLDPLRALPRFQALLARLDS